MPPKEQERQKYNRETHNPYEEIDKKILSYVSMGVNGHREVVELVKRDMPEVEEPHIHYALWGLLDEGKLEHTLERRLVKKS